ncbi:MAG: ATP phosphoribosyltransferase [Fimbriimonas sp.]|jgi:ATP phosphoribosyltransferase
MSSESAKLKLGLPKGSLQEATFSLFARAGFTMKVDSRSYQPTVNDSEIEPILLRPQEIPKYLESGVIDAGLTGLDWIEDTGADVQLVTKLQYSKATNRVIRIVLAVAQDSDIQSVKDLEGKRIATEYQGIAADYLSRNGVKAEVDFSWGACEVKVGTVADAIIVNTETGNSLRAHNLRIVEEILQSTTQFVCSKAAWSDSWKREKIESLEILLTGAMNAARLVGLKMNVPKAKEEAILDLLSFIDSPTISPLRNSEWVAVEVILDESKVRSLIPKLKREGATGLVEYPLNKVIY